ncbi:30S ribosome-binding factor RbfA [Fundidesulfovibrio butyratiphilus]
MTTHAGPSRRSMRLADQILRELALMLAEEIQDPRLELVTISGVRLNPDLSVATVLYTLHGDDERRKAAAQGLEKAKGFLRSHLSRALKMKSVPELRFKHDDFLETMVYGQPHA